MDKEREDPVENTQMSDSGMIVNRILRLIALDENFSIHWNRVRRCWYVYIPALNLEVNDPSLLTVLSAALTTR